MEGERRLLHPEEKHICLLPAHLQIHTVLPCSRRCPGDGPGGHFVKGVWRTHSDLQSRVAWLRYPPRAVTPESHTNKKWGLERTGRCYCLWSRNERAPGPGGISLGKPSRERPEPGVLPGIGPRSCSMSGAPCSFRPSLGSSSLAVLFSPRPFSALPCSRRGSGAHLKLWACSHQPCDLSHFHVP